MLNSERQAHIKAALSTAAEPLSASSFARRFTVSRQTIVGDIALLRAQGEPIIATPRGYSYRCRHETVLESGRAVSWPSFIRINGRYSFAQH